MRLEYESSRPEQNYKGGAKPWNFRISFQQQRDVWRVGEHFTASLRTLVVVAERDAEALRQEAQKLLADMAPIEAYCGYPGPALMAQVGERLRAGDWSGFARLVQRISLALLSNSYRDDAEVWKTDEEGEARLPDLLPPSMGRGQSRKPYFEVLVVAAGERSTWSDLRETFRRLRRTEDAFVYEPVIVGSLEDAILATVFNYDLQAVVIVDGFAYASPFAGPSLRTILAQHVPADAVQSGRDLSLLLAKGIHRVRPELDVYLTTDRNVAPSRVRKMRHRAARLLRGRRAAGDPPRILDGINDRYETPYFDNLKNYAPRPIGTFHALPIARGKSIFKSNWIRDMG